MRYLVLGLLLLATTAAGAEEQASSDPDAGATFEAVYTGEVVSTVSGGIRPGTQYLGNLDLIADLDLEKLAGWDDWELFLYVLGVHGGDPTAENIGDFQARSNIEGPDTVLLYEAWLEKRFLAEESLSLRFGIYDLNSEFDTTETGGYFLNSSHGIGAEYAQAGQNGPSIFPVTSPGVRLQYRPTPGSYLQLAVLDGVPGDPERPFGTHLHHGPGEGFLAAGELGFLLGDEPLEDYDAKIALGGWGFTGEFDDVLELDGAGDPLHRTGNRGCYILAEGRVYREEEDPTQGLSLFARYGVADPDVNQLQSYAGAGLAYVGPFPDRDQDVIGLAVAAARNGAPYRRATARAGTPVDEWEVSLEFIYRAQVTSWLAITPHPQPRNGPLGQGRLHGWAAIRARALRPIVGRRHRQMRR